MIGNVVGYIQSASCHWSGKCRSQQSQYSWPALMSVVILLFVDCPDSFLCSKQGTFP